MMMHFPVILSEAKDLTNNFMLPQQSMLCAVCEVLRRLRGSG
jgi:hypothetical protein